MTKGNGSEATTSRYSQLVRPIGIVGSLSRDSSPGSEPRPGGCPFHAARVLRLLERPSRIVTKCGEEQRRLLLRPLLGQGVPVSWRGGKNSTCFEIVPDGDRRTMRVEEVGDSWSLEEASGWVAEAIEPCEWVHVAPLLRDDFPAEALAEIARGRFVSLDGQGLARVRKTGPLTLDADFDRELLRHVTALKLAEEEALALFGAAKVGEIGSGELASLGVPEVLITRGSRGVVVFAEGELSELPARPPVADVDATGAGDEFAAIYIAARARGRPPVLAARRAAAFVGAVLSRRLPG